MSELERRAWLLERFGSDGQSLVDGLTDVLWRCHLGMADAQEAAPMRSQAVYGQIWNAMHEAMVREFGSLPTAQLIRPPSAPYKVLAVKGTVLFPWRFGHRTVQDLDAATMGPHVSPTRQAVLSGTLALSPMLPIGEVPTADADQNVVEVVESYRSAFRQLASERSVVVLAYASNATALLSAYWGDALRLRPDGTIEWGFREQLDLTRSTPPRGRLRVVARHEHRLTFDNAPLKDPRVRTRKEADREDDETGQDNDA